MPRKRLSLLAGAILLFFICSIAEAKIVDLVGVVRDSITSTPLQNATVIIIQTNDTAYTDASGTYTFYNLTADFYTLLIGHTDYSTTILTSVNVGLGCCIGIRGNIDNDGAEQINVADLTYLVNYLFKGGPVPFCMDEGNINALAQIDVADITYLVNYLFRAGPVPPVCP